MADSFFIFSLYTFDFIFLPYYIAWNTQSVLYTNSDIESLGLFSTSGR